MDNAVYEGTIKFINADHSTLHIDVEEHGLKKANIMNFNLHDFVIGDRVSVVILNDEIRTVTKL